MELQLRQSNTDNLTTQELDSLSAINRNSNDLQKLVTERSLRQQINVGVRGGSKKAKLYWNTGFLNEDGIVLNSDYRRLNSLLKVDMTPNKRLTIGTKLNLSYEEQNGLQEPAVFQQLVERVPYFLNKRIILTTKNLGIITILVPSQACKYKNISEKI